MASQSFDSTTSVLSVGGVVMSSFGDNKITISRDDDSTTVIKGMEGDNIYAINNNKSGTVSFDLLYGSDYDTFMDQLPSYSGLVPVSFMDTGNLKQLVTFGRVMSQPDIVINTAPESRTWTLVVDSVNMNDVENLSDLWSNLTSYEL